MKGEVLVCVYMNIELPVCVRGFFGLFRLTSDLTAESSSDKECSGFIFKIVGILKFP